MPGKKVKFTRTEAAAKSDRLTKWDLIAAIAEDADEAGIAISGTESRIAAKSALAAAGSEYRDGTVSDLCVLAKFDYESTAAQRRIWRRYGWTSVREFAKAGWSQSAASQVLDGERKSRDEITAALSTTRRPSGPKTSPFDERCSQWVQRVARLMHDGALLLEESEKVDALGGHAEMALMIYQKLADKYLDAELRQLLESEGVR